MLTSTKVWTSLLCLALLAGYVLAFPPFKIPGTLLETCPMVLAGLDGVELGLEQTVLDDLDPDDYLVRQYSRPDGSPVWMVIVYFQNARLGAHDPQLCYRSQGYQVQSLPAGTLETEVGSLPYEGFLAIKGPRRELVHYFWYTAGGFQPDVKSWRDRMFFQGLKSNRSFGAFVRISTTEGNNAGEAVAAVHAIMRDLAPHLPGFFPTGTSGEEGEG